MHLACIIHIQELRGVKGIISQQVDLGVKADSFAIHSNQRISYNSLTPNEVITPTMNNAG